MPLNFIYSTRSVKPDHGLSLKQDQLMNSVGMETVKILTEVLDTKIFGSAVVFFNVFSSVDDIFHMREKSFQNFCVLQLFLFSETKFCIISWADNVKM